MQSFKDNTGQTWEIPMNVSIAERVKTFAGFNLLDDSDDQRFAKLATDAVLLVAVLFAACGKQADQRSIDKDGFAELITGDTIDDATTALLEAIANFSPARKRAAMLKAISKMKEGENYAMDIADQKIDAIDVKAIVESILGKPSTESPDTSALTQGR